MTRCAQVLIRCGAAALFVALASCTTSPPNASQAGAPLAAAGAVRVYVAGDIADCRQQPPERAAARLTAQLVPDGATVLAPGDLVYQQADTATLLACFEPTWGRHRAHVLAVPGNHDYVGGSTQDFRRYFGLEARATSADFVAYATRLSDDWLLLALDSNVAGQAMDRQVEWLEQVLESERGKSPTADTGSRRPRCLAVMWHTPVYSSGLHRGSGDHMRPLWQLIDAYDADVLLNGHEHFYEAFDPIDGSGEPRRMDGHGVRQFTVGTGGARLYGFWRPPYASRARVLSHGVLEMTLENGRYAWRFLDVDGRVRDAGAATCRRSS